MRVSKISNLLILKRNKLPVNIKTANRAYSPKPERLLLQIIPLPWWHPGCKNVYYSDFIMKKGGVD